MPKLVELINGPRDGEVFDWSHFGNRLRFRIPPRVTLAKRPEDEFILPDCDEYEYERVSETRAEFVGYFKR